MPGPSVPAIDVLGIAHVQRLENPLQPVFVRRYRDEMNMICHQALSQDIGSILVAVLRKEIQVSVTILVKEDYLLPAVASLSNMMWYPSEYLACDSWHHGTLTVFTIKG